MTAPVNESFYDKPVKQEDGTILVIVRDAEGNEIGWNLTVPSSNDSLS